MRASFDLEENECGTGAFDVADELDFDVEVSVDDEEIRWSATSVTDAIDGAVSGDSFVMTSSRSVDQGNGCIIDITFRYVGTFEESGGALVDMEGDLTTHYEAQDPYFCRKMVGTSSGFLRLPCEIVYSFDLDVDE